MAGLKHSIILLHSLFPCLLWVTHWHGAVTVAMVFNSVSIVTVTCLMMSLTLSEHSVAMIFGACVCMVTKSNNVSSDVSGISV